MLKLDQVMKSVIPVRSLGLLMAIGFADLVVTAVLFQRGQIVELNPLMRPLLHSSPWLFSVVKGGTLAATWICMARYARTNLQFVDRACWVGAVLYMTIWTAWFFTGRPL